MSQVQGSKLSNFREWVAGNRVLDGDLVANKDGSLSKVNYGGTFKRWLLKFFNLARTSGEAESAAVRDSFYNALKAHVDGVQGLDENKKTALLNRLQHELCAPAFKNVPLSRRTVRMCIDAVDRETAGDVNKIGDKALPKDAVEVEGLLGKFTLNKTQYKAMFEQVLLYLENKDDAEKISPEKLKAIKGQIKGYLKAFDGYAGKKGGNLGNLGVFFMGSMDLESVKNKMIKFFDSGVLPTRANKKVKPGTVLSEELQKEFQDLRSRRMNEGDNELRKSVDVTALHPANKKDVEQIQGAKEVQPGQEKPQESPLPPTARLVADLLFCETLLETEEYQFGDGERVGQMMSKHFDAFKDLCLTVANADAEAARLSADEKGKPDKIKQAALAKEAIMATDFFKHLRLILAKKEQATGRDALIDSFVEFFRGVNSKVFGGAPTKDTFSKATVYEKCEEIYELADKLQIDQKIDAALKESAKEFSAKIVGTLTDNFSNLSKSGEKSDEPPAFPEQESIEERLKKNSNNLLLKVLPKYFENGNPITLRRMFAASIRMTDQKSLQNAIDGIKGEKTKQHLDFGAFLTGAGPYMLKLLQGLERCELERGKSYKGNEEAHEAAEILKQIDKGVTTIKSKMPGLDFDTVYAHLLALGKESGATFESIKLKRILGAASVGVTYLCDVKGKEKAGQQGNVPSKDVVIKMIRPGVQQQLDQEYKLFKKAAEEADLSHEVEVTYKSISREFNLKDESDSLNTGLSVYGKGTKGPKIEAPFVLSTGESIVLSSEDKVGSVQREDNVPATENCMVMKVAGGDPVSTVIDDFGKEIDNLFAVDETKGKKPLDQLLAEVGKKREELGRLRTALLQVSTKLVKGLCDSGSEGFFHGDLHGGNMMYVRDTGELTLIDYGKGTKLTEAQTRVFRRLLLLASYGEGLNGPFVAKAFIGAYEELMRAEDATFTLSEGVRSKMLREFSDVRLDLARPDGAFGVLGSFGMKAKAAGVSMPTALYDFFETCRKLGNEISQVEMLQTKLDEKCSSSDQILDECKAQVNKCVNTFKECEFLCPKDVEGDREYTLEKKAEQRNRILFFFNEENPHATSLHSLQGFIGENLEDLETEKLSSTSFEGTPYANTIQSSEVNEAIGLMLGEVKTVMVEQNCGGKVKPCYCADLYSLTFSNLPENTTHRKYATDQFRYLLWCVKMCQTLMTQTNFPVLLDDPQVQKLFSRLKGAVSFFRMVIDKAGIDLKNAETYVADADVKARVLDILKNYKNSEVDERNVYHTYNALKGVCQFKTLLDAADEMVRELDTCRDKLKPSLSVGGKTYDGYTGDTTDRHLFIHGYEVGKKKRGEERNFYHISDDFPNDDYDYAGSSWKKGELPSGWLQSPEVQKLTVGEREEYGRLYAFVGEHVGNQYLTDMKSPESELKLGDLMALRKKAKEIESVVSPEKCSVTKMMQSQVSSFFRQEQADIQKSGNASSDPFDIFLKKVGQTLSYFEEFNLSNLETDCEKLGEDEIPDLVARYDEIKKEISDEGHDFSLEMNLFKVEIDSAVEYKVRQNYSGSDQSGINLTDEEVREKVEALRKEVKSGETFQTYSKTDAYALADDQKKAYIENLFLVAFVNSEEYVNRVKEEVAQNS